MVQVSNGGIFVLHGVIGCERNHGVREGGFLNMAVFRCVGVLLIDMSK